MKTNTLSTVLILLLAHFAPLHTAQAVSPPPDGGYPGGNTAEGQNALFSLDTTVGSYNTAVGFLSLRGNAFGSFNTGIGAGTLALNTAEENTATGTGALLFNTTGFQNTANGAFALFSNTEGYQNTADGVNALSSNTTGAGNTATGVVALLSNTIGNGNTAIGQEALRDNTEGNQNTATGTDALLSNTTGNYNTADGWQALVRNTEGSNNTAIGPETLSFNVVGEDNTAIGHLALWQSTGTNNTALGSGAGYNVSTASNVICIGAPGDDVSDSCFIGNIFGQASASGIAVLINGNGRLGTTTSSKRFKEDIKSMDKASETLFAFRPVTFHYTREIDPVGKSQFGLVAEDVEKVNPDLVVRDKEGKPYSVRYDQVNAMLLNEFLKARRQIDAQQKQIEVLIAGLQRVSAQFEVNKLAPQPVKNTN
jgi:Chaperone of endosialidase